MRDMIYDEVVGFVPVDDVVESIDVKFDTCIGANVATWHPYPQEKPQEDGRYLVTDRFNEVSIADFVNNGSEIVSTKWDVIAWTELPKAYEP